MKMSPNACRTDFISSSLLFSLIGTVLTPGNVLPEKKQNYTCKDSENQTIALNVTFKSCDAAEMDINGTVVADKTEYKPPIINVTFGTSAVINGCHIIQYRCFYGGSEEWLILTPIRTERSDTAVRTERSDTGLLTGATVGICLAIIFLVIIIIIIIRVRWRFIAPRLKKFLPVSSPQTSILLKKNSRMKNPTDDMASDQTRPSEAEVAKLVPSGDGEGQETLESSKNDNIIAIE